MKSKLPHHLTLPNDPDRELWKYYQSLTCTTILDRAMFLVVALVPLLDRDNKFEIYNVITSQHPFYDSNLSFLPTKFCGKISTRNLCSGYKSQENKIHDFESR